MPSFFLLSRLRRIQIFLIEYSIWYQLIIKVLDKRGMNLLKKIIKLNISVLVIWFLLIIVYGAVPAWASQQYAVYTAPDGFKIVSYSPNWKEVSKLKSVYDELLKNTHGEEFKLLKRIDLYPGTDPSGSGAAGRWMGQWKIVNGVPILTGSRYIEIFNCSKMDTVKDMARILSHEYGHHFTYYYFFKKEKKQWDDWRKTGFAEARGLKNHPKVNFQSVEHKWLIQEIAAEDYVQLFGSATGKTSTDFKDIKERVDSGESGLTYSTDIFNYYPQENYEIPLAANRPALKQYWLNASGLSDKKGKAPSHTTVRLEGVDHVEFSKTPQYKFVWDKSSDDKDVSNLEYTLVWFELSNTHSLKIHPIKTVSGKENLNAVFGSVSNVMDVWEETIPDGLAYFVLYIKDQDGNITSSKITAVNMSYPFEPESVIVDDNSILSGFWFPPRVTVNQQQLDFDVVPVIKNGRTLVPLRAIFERLGAVVTWDAKSKTIKAEKDSTTVILKIGSTSALVNGKKVTLDVPAEISKGRTLVPIRFISESFGAQVSWNQQLRLVKIVN